MAESNTFRCYYDDGHIITVDGMWSGQTNACPLEDNGSPLIKSELSIIEDVESTIGFPWFLLVLGLIILTSQERN
jgi:hypothetical protein